MTDSSAVVSELLRTWRRANTLGGMGEHVAQAMDEANDRGFDDRALLMAATGIGLHLVGFLAEADGDSLDATLEVMIREGVEWKP